jgi:hypothetical protein
MIDTCTQIVFNGYHLGAFVLSGGIGILFGMAIGINKEYERQQALKELDDITLPDWI